ncbi:MAG: nuclease/transposase family protein [Acidimicrobiales bacterium]
MGRYTAPSNRSRKRPRGSPTFVCTIPLRATPRKVKKLETRFEVARLVYNACLGECFRRVEKMRRDPLHEKVKALPKQVEGRSNPKRFAIYAALRADYGFTKRDLASYGSSLRKAFVRGHVGAQEAQVLAERAYDAANSWFVGLRGRPRFKAKGHGLHSLVVKDGNGDVRISEDGAGITWAGLELAFVLAPSDPVYWWAAIHVAAGRLLRVGITRTPIRGRPTYRALLVLDGVALQRYEVGGELVTLDPGLGYANAVTDTGVYREQLAGPNGSDPGIGFDRARIRRLSRKLDRQHRAASPECFDEQGRHVKGHCLWRERSNEASITQARLSEGHRVMAGHRRTLHGNLQNRILGIGVHVVAEKNSYRSFQRTYGRNVRDRAPGGFITGLLRKAESAGGVGREGDPRIAAPSQSCVCGARKKKPLSLRVHACECGVGPIQRDVFSAFLWRHIGADGTLDAPKARHELSRRQDIAVHAASSYFKQQVPPARKRYGRVGGPPAPEPFAAKTQNPIPRADTKAVPSVESEMGSASPRAVVEVLAAAAVP